MTIRPLFWQYYIGERYRNNNYILNSYTQGSKQILQLIRSSEQNVTYSPNDVLATVNTIGPNCVALDLHQFNFVPKRSYLKEQAQIFLFNKLSSLVSLEEISLDFHNPLLVDVLKTIGSCNKIKTVKLSNFRFDSCQSIEPT